MCISVSVHIKCVLDLILCVIAIGLHDGSCLWVGMLRLKLSSINKASEVWQCSPEKYIKGCVNSQVSPDRSCIGCMSFIEDELLNALFCQARCPPEDVYCRTTEFDNIKGSITSTCPLSIHKEATPSTLVVLDANLMTVLTGIPRTSEWMLLGSTIDGGNA